MIEALKVHYKTVCIRKRVNNNIRPNIYRVEVEVSDQKEDEE